MCAWTRAFQSTNGHVTAAIGSVPGGTGPETVTGHRVWAN